MDNLPENTSIQIVFINLLLVLIFLNFHLRKFSFINKINKSKFLNSDKIDYFILLFFLLLIYNYLNNYFSLYLITDIHENAWINTALAFSENINPLDEKNISEYANLYSTFWPLIISKLSFFIDPKISSIKLLMTVINLFSFIIFCFLIIKFLNFKNKTNITLIFFIFYLLFTQRTNLGSSPHTIGIILYTLAIFISFFKRDNFYFFISLALVTIATLFKQYFFLGFFLIILSNIKELNFQKIIAIISWLILTIIIYLVLLINFEMYFDIHYNFYIQYSKLVEFEFYRIFYELGYLLKFFPFLILLFVFSIKEYNFKDSYKKNFFIISLLIVIFVILKMWTNKGNFGIYSLHLILPILLIYIFEYLNKIKIQRNNLLRLFNLFIIFTIIMNFQSEFGFIDKKKIRENETMVHNLSKIIVNKSLENLFLDIGLTIIKDNFEIKHYDPGHGSLIKNYVNSRKNGYFKRTQFEELFLKNFKQNENHSSVKFDKEILLHEDNNVSNYDLLICSVCKINVEDYKILYIGKLHIRSSYPSDIKILIKEDKF